MFDESSRLMRLLKKPKELPSNYALVEAVRVLHIAETVERISNEIVTKFEREQKETGEHFEGKSWRRRKV